MPPAQPRVALVTSAAYPLLYEDDLLLARALERSPSTVLRALRELVDERRIEKHGFARATRYSLRAATR